MRCATYTHATAAPPRAVQLLHLYVTYSLHLCIIYVRVISHVGMSHVPHGNESCPTWGCPSVPLNTNIEPLPDSKISPLTTNIIYDYTYNL